MVKGKRQKAKGKTTIQKSKRFTLLAFALYFCLLSFDFFLGAAGACPGCKEALFDPGQITQRVSTARGYALSIGLLLGIPVLLLAGIATLIVRSRRKSEQTSEQTRIDSPSLSR